MINLPDSSKYLKYCNVVHAEKFVKTWKRLVRHTSNVVHTEK